MSLFAVVLPENIQTVIDIIKTISFVDIIDIACVSVLLYYLYKFVRERRAGKLALGVMLLLAVDIVSHIWDMYLLRFIMQNIFQVGVITLVVLFQPELRSVLEKVGATPFRGLKNISDTKKHASVQSAIEGVVSAVFDMSESKTGALIVFERSTKLGDVILTGTVIDANPAPFMIKNIFFNKAPMHDGALIIRDGRLYSAGCYLPLSNNPDIIKDLGTRHRAGIGMSENSDAVVIIVSEETGVVSAAIEGRLMREFGRASLTKLLNTELMGDSDESRFKLIGKVKELRGKNKK